MRRIGDDPDGRNRQAVRRRRLRNDMGFHVDGVRTGLPPQSRFRGRADDGYRRAEHDATKRARDASAKGSATSAGPWVAVRPRRRCPRRRRTSLAEARLARPPAKPKLSRPRHPAAMAWSNLAARFLPSPLQITRVSGPAAMRASNPSPTTTTRPPAFSTPTSRIGQMRCWHAADSDSAPAPRAERFSVSVIAQIEDARESPSQYIGLPPRARLLLASAPDRRCRARLPDDPISPAAIRPSSAHAVCDAVLVAGSWPR